MAVNVMQMDNAQMLASFGMIMSHLALQDGSQLTDLYVVRHVPNRRCVCRAVWSGKSVYVKLFFGHKAEHYALRDVRGAVYLQRAGLLTPTMLRYSQLSQLEGRAVIFEAIASAENAEVVLLNASEASQLALATKAVKTVADLHAANLVQTDMYLKNFLVQDEAIYTIDGDGVRLINGLSKNKALANLSQLLSKFDVLMLDRHLSALLATYAEARSWQPLQANEVRLTIKAARVKAANAYADKKVFRQCTDVDVKNNQQSFVAVRSDYATLSLPQAIDGLDAYITSGSIIKNGNTCTVALAEIDQLRVVIKRYNIKNIWHAMSRAFRKTRAAASWGNAHRLQLLGLETAQPIALIEKRTVGLRGQAYFVAAYIDAPDMLAFFKQTSDKTLRANAVKQVVQLCYRLYLLELSHGDMKATNIKVLADGRPSLIDLDSMQQHKSAASAQKAHVKDIKRFMRNWKEQPTLYNAFIKVFKVVYANHALLRAAQILE